MRGGWTVKKELILQRAGGTLVNLHTKVQKGGASSSPLEAARHRRLSAHASNRAQALIRKSHWKQTMKAGRKLCQALLATLILTVGALTGFSKPQQKPSSSTEMSPQPSLPAAAAISSATFVAQVEVGRSGQQTIVRVEGNGPLTCQPERLSNPERLVLDFSGARLRVGRTSIPSDLQPVRRVRLGQFKPYVTRVVIDLEYVGPYTVQSEGNSFTVAFAASNAVPASMLGAPPTPTRKEKSAAQARRGEAAQQPAPRPARNIAVMLRPESSALRPAALASPVLAETKVYPFENAFENGMLTFRAHDQTLRSILGQIGAKANVKIVLSEGLGDEKLSVEFRHYRLDEALRQVLKDYDVFFFYGVDENEKSSAPLNSALLKSVWVYAASLGRGFKPTPSDTAAASTQELQRMLAEPDPEVRARAIEAFVRRNGSQSADAVRETLKDPDEGVRTKALHLALSSGVEFPQELLIDLALNDQSMSVRFLALQALPVDPKLRWVAERALHDLSQVVVKQAQAILEQLDAPNPPPRSAPSRQETPHQ